MSVRRDDEGIVLDGVCPIEDAEALLHHVQDGAGFVEAGTCRHLHAACLQVLLASGLPLRGVPDSPALAAWLPSLLAATTLVPSEA